MSQIDESVLDAEINKAGLTNLIEECLVEATRQGASDIHIVPKGGDCTEFCFRIDGKLVLWHRQEQTKPEAVAAVVKDRSVHMDRFEQDKVQDGFLQRTIDGHTIRFRVNLLPVVGKAFDRKYEQIAIRILDDRKLITDLDRLGLQEKARGDLDEALRKPRGMILAAGPTGSGRTTTLIAALHQVMDPSVNVLTLEYPVEYVIEGASQIRISGEATYDLIVRAMLRHDPDVVLMAELWNRLSVDVAMKAAITGRLVFSALHTDDAVAGVVRLLRMGIEPTLVGNALNIVLAQRLVRTLCVKCKAPAERLDEALLSALGFTRDEIEQTTFYQPVGCKECRGGYKGRIPINESLVFDKAFRRYVTGCSVEIDEEEMRQKALESGMFTFADSAKARLKDGVTSLEEIGAVWEE